jgi:tRNA/rRNA methyltransferase
MRMTEDINPQHPALLNTTIVLVRPQNQGNLGATARVMKNFGFGRLALVAPHIDIESEARARAWNALDILENARSHDSTVAALTEYHWACATTRRAGRRRGRTLPFRDLPAAWLEAASIGPCALVFGPESAGLANEDLIHCQRWLSIPTSPRQPSLNLSQAVAVIIAILGMASMSTAEPTVLSQRSVAPIGEFEAMVDAWFQVLGRVGFLNPQNPRHIMWDLRGVLNRAHLDQREVTIFRGIASKIIGALDGSSVSDNADNDADR